MSWDIGNMTAALPTSGGGDCLPTSTTNAWGTESTPVASTEPAVPEQPIKTPQEHGWVTKQGYNYASFNKSGKTENAVEDAEQAAQENSGGESAVLVIPEELLEEWAGSAAVYDCVWDDDVGDIGPAHKILEDQLFGSEFHVRAGIEFDKIEKLKVFQEGLVRIEPIRSFDQAGLHPAMRENIRLARYNVPTPIQQYCLPAVFKGYDVVACAQTGSGKTAAFLVPILSKLMGKAKRLAAPRPNPATFVEGQTPPVRAEPLVLIVVPTRELATQVFDEARRFCYRSMLRPAVIYGGGPIGEQVRQLQKGCDVLIGTPGRLCDFINRPHILTLSRLRYMVIDEADEMLQSDWEEELKKIMSGGDQEEGNIKYMMFSATFPKIAQELATKHLSADHVRIRVGRAGSSVKNIQQDVVFVAPHKKRQACFDLLMAQNPGRTIIFVNSKRSADELDDFLYNREIPCTSIHGDRTQREREDSIRAFKKGTAPVLIATGVSSRGLDIRGVYHVINYDLPSTQFGGIDEYTHRIGRTGRIGNIGLATSFYNEKDDSVAPSLVKVLLENDQIIPDFLEQYIPEGFTKSDVEGHFKGDLETLDFEAEEATEFGDMSVPAEDGAGGAGGTEDAWGTPAAAPEPTAGGDSWGAPAPGGW